MMIINSSGNQSLRAKNKHHDIYVYAYINVVIFVSNFGVTQSDTVLFVETSLWKLTKLEVYSRGISKFTRNDFYGFINKRHSSVLGS